MWHKIPPSQSLLNICAIHTQRRRFIVLPLMSESIVCNRCTFWIKEISRAVRVLPQSVLVHLLHEASFIFCFKPNSNTEFISFSVFFILFLSCQRVNTWFSCTTCRAVTLTQISLWRFLWTPLHHCVTRSFTMFVLSKSFTFYAFCMKTLLIVKNEFTSLRVVVSNHGRRFVFFYQ